MPGDTLKSMTHAVGWTGEHASSTLVRLSAYLHGVRRKSAGAKASPCAECGQCAQFMYVLELERGFSFLLYMFHVVYDQFCLHIHRECFMAAEKNVPMVVTRPALSHDSFLGRFLWKVLKMITDLFHPLSRQKQFVSTAEKNPAHVRQMVGVCHRFPDSASAQVNLYCRH